MAGADSDSGSPLTPSPGSVAQGTPSASIDPESPAGHFGAVGAEAALEFSSIEPATCPASAEHPAIACYRASTPLDYADPGGGAQVSLLVAVVDNDPDDESVPVMFLQGGPGVATVSSSTSFVGLAHDVILFDQRGTGASEPKLACAEVDALWDTPDVDDEIVYQAYDDCAQRLRGAGVDLDMFHTQAVAADADLIRQMLGYQQWSIWGVSYGTRVGLTLLRDHPHDLRAAVLDSIVPFGVDFFGSIPDNALRSIAALDEACKLDSCLDDHGDFGDTLAELVARLDDSPAVVDATRPVSGDLLAYEVDGAELLGLVFSQLYSTRQLRSLPRQISRADFGGLDEIVGGYVWRRDPNRLDLASGVYYTTWCREEFPYHNPDLDDQALAEGRERFGDPFVEAFEADSIERLCGSFDVAPASAESLAPVTGSTPTLVLAGAFDPITPPAWSRRTADDLSNATFVEFSDHGHGAATPCARQVREAFLVAPEADLDLSCVEQAGAPDFD